MCCGFGYVDSHAGTLVAANKSCADFWSTTCPNCPAAVNVLQEYAKQYEHIKEKVLFLIVNTDNPELARPIIQKNHWKYGLHVHMPLPEKEKMKEFLAMKTLPHHVMVRTRSGNSIGREFDLSVDRV